MAVKFCSVSINPFFLQTFDIVFWLCFARSTNSVFWFTVLLQCVVASGSKHTNAQNEQLQLSGNMQRLTIHDLHPELCGWFRRFSCRNQVRVAYVCSLSTLKIVHICSCFTDVNFRIFVCWDEGITNHHVAPWSKCCVSHWNQKVMAWFCEGHRWQAPKQVLDFGISTHFGWMALFFCESAMETTNIIWLVKSIWFCYDKEWTRHWSWEDDVNLGESFLHAVKNAYFDQDPKSQICWDTDSDCIECHHAHV